MPSDQSTDPLRLKLASLSVVGLCFVLFLVVRGLTDAYAVIVIPLHEAFGWNRGEISSVYSIGMIVGGLLAPLTGWMFDRWGPRTLYTAGLAAAGLGVSATAFASSLWQLWISIGLLLGFAFAAVGMVPASALVSRWFRERLGTAMGCVMAANGLGIMAMVPAAQVLVEAIGWRATYQWLGAMTLVLVLPLALLPWGRIARGHPDYYRPSARASAVSETAPWTLKRALTDSAFWGLLLVFGLTAFAMPGIYVHMVAYFIELGFAPITAASIFGACGMLSPAGAILWGLIADRFGLRRSVIVSIILSILALLLLAGFTLVPNVLVIPLFVLLFGGTQTARSPVVLTMASRLFSGSRLATINGVIIVGGGGGIGVGSWLNGVLHDLIGSYAALPWLSVLWLVISIVPLFTVRALRRM